MSLERHIEWLSLIEVRGSFLAVSALDKAMPQGIEIMQSVHRRRLRNAYEEWCEVVDEENERLGEFHDAWTRYVVEELLEYDSNCLKSGQDFPEELAYQHPQSLSLIRPDFVVTSLEGPRLFIATYPPGTDLEEPLQGDSWLASPLERMTMMCREKEVAIGLVTNGETWTLIGALQDGTTSYGSWYARIWFQEPITLQAFQSLLSIRRCFGPEDERLDQLFTESLEYQQEVTDTLGEQVRRSVELLVQALGRADQDRNGELLKDVEPQELYEGGLVVMMRLVFLLCAEERELLLLGDPVYDQHYAISTLRAQLREDADKEGEEVLERRYDAWSRMLSVFRAVFGGIKHESLRMIAMGGSLFDPDRFAFLEGRAKGTSWRESESVPLPIDNRTTLLLLRSLQILEYRGGARYLSYRGLDIEQIGHVYEGLLDYTVAKMPALTLGLTGSKAVSLPTIGLTELERLKAGGIAKAATELQKLTGRTKDPLKKALEADPDEGSLPALINACRGDEELAARLVPFAGLLRHDIWGMPVVYAKGALAVTLGVGRRQSGSHYTPKALTEPIVATTLRPILEAMGEQPAAEKILALKVCDPAMGSGAFLVEVCRQLGAELVEAWARAEEEGSFVRVDGVVISESGEAELLTAEVADRVITARRLVADQCLYGVDKNHMAVDLAKLSLWLITMAKGRPFGFLDHKLKSGDSLVGLNKDQIAGFMWKEERPAQINWLEESLRESLEESWGWRSSIGDLGEFDYAEKKQVYGESEKALNDARLVGDLCIAAFFEADKDKAREELRNQYRSKVEAWRASPANRHNLEAIVDELRGGEKPLPPMHWEIEFPEVFERENPGFDAMVGNPPFLGGTSISTANRKPYLDWITSYYPESGDRMDLVAYFFRRCFLLQREHGTFGLIATNTISQGDTRKGGLSYICNSGGMIYCTTGRLRWPGQAAVMVAVVHLIKGEYSGSLLLDGRVVTQITAFLFHRGGNDAPKCLKANEKIAFNGVYILGMGFTFNDAKANATPISEMNRIVKANPKASDRIRPYIGGEEVNDSPTHSPTRYVINLSGLSEESARQHYPELIAILEEKVRPERLRKAPSVATFPWWRFWREREEMQTAIQQFDQFLVCSRHQPNWGLAFMTSDVTPSDALVVFAVDDFAQFAQLQSRTHELWTRFFGSSMKDDLRYTPSDCFETFPFSANWQTDSALEAAGKAYYEFRAELMVRSDEGLTKTYNRFRDPNNHEPDIVKLRELHAAMDRAVLDAYGWDDIPTDCEFLLDYEIDEETWGNKKKPYRYRWPEAVHDEVLARLLDLNQKRYEEEVAAGLHGQGSGTARKKKAATKRPQSGSQDQIELF